MSRTAAVFISAVLLLAGCTAPTDDPEPEPATEEEPTAVEVGDLTDGPVQDTWIYEQIESATESGLFDITSDVLSGLETEESGVDLPGGMTFFPLTSPAHIETGSGDTRDDLDVIAGITRGEEAEALQIIATPREDRSVDADDVVILDLSFLDLPAGAPLVASYAFGQGLPAEGDELDADGLELLAQRMAEERFQWFAVEGDDGGTHPGVQTTLGPFPRREARRRGRTKPRRTRVRDTRVTQCTGRVASSSMSLMAAVGASR